MFKKKEKPAEVKKDLSTSHSRKDSSKSDREDEDSAQLDKLDDKKPDSTPARKDSTVKEEPNSNGSKSGDLSDSYKKREERKRQDSIDQGTTSGDVIIRIDSARSVKDKKKSSKSGDDHATSKTSSRSLLKIDEPIVHIHRDNDEKIETASELSELDNYTLDQDDNIKLDAAYNYFSNDFIKAVNKLHDISRNANGQLMPPEIVIIGPTSHGKSALLEALIGQQFNALGLGAVTKRPLLLQMHHTASSTVQWTLKRDTLTPGGTDRSVECKELATEIAKRNSKYSKTPIVVRAEGSAVLNMHWIDTPGVPQEDAAEYEQVVSIVSDVTRPLHRIIVCVEELPHSDWTQLKMIKLMKQLDPDHSRSLHVFTRTHSILREYTALQDINKHLSAVPSDIKPWLVSLPATKTRQSLADTAAYRKRLLQTVKRDVRTFEQLHGDKKWETQLGVINLRLQLNEKIVRRYRDLVPEVSSQLKHKQGEHDKSLAALKNNLSNVSHAKLRTASQNYTVELVHALDKLVAGTSEANAAVNGQTLVEEKSAQGNFEWSDNFNKKIRVVDADKWIPFSTNKIYGGQQFERLLAEFKAVCDSVELPSPSSDDIATAVGTNKVNNAPNLIWVASDYAQHQSSELLKPLIDQLLKRAVFILRRFVEVAERLVLSEHKKKKKSDEIENMEHYPYFTNYTRDNYYKFIDRQAKQCRDKCLEEFYSTRTIYWEVLDYANDKLKSEPKTDELKAATKLANEVLKVVLTRVSKNLLLKCYQFLLEPLQTALLADLQHELHSMREEDIDQLFQLTSVKERLKSEEHTHEKAVAACGEWMRQLTAASEQLNASPKQDK